MSDLRHSQARYITGTSIHVSCSLIGRGPARPTLIWLQCSWCLVRFSTTVCSTLGSSSTAARGIANVFWSHIQMEGFVGARLSSWRASRDLVLMLACVHVVCCMLLFWSHSTFLLSWSLCCKKERTYTWMCLCIVESANMIQFPMMMKECFQTAE